MAALTVPVRHALRVEHPPHLVRLVAIDAGRDKVGLLLPQLAANYLLVDFLDAGVAARAGAGDVLLGDRGARVGVRQNEMRGVTTAAHRGHGEAAAEQSFTVDAFGVILQDAGLRDVVGQLDGRALVVALAAQPGDFHGRGGRAGVRGAQDVVGSVALLAARGQAVAALGRPSVEALGVLALLICVAAPAVYGGQFLGMRCGLAGVVTVVALEAGVRRGAQGRGIEGGRHARLAFAGAASGLVAAGAFLRAGQGLGLLGGGEAEREPEQAENGHTRSHGELRSNPTATGKPRHCSPP